MSFPENSGPPPSEIFLNLNQDEYARVRFLQREIGIRDIPSLFTYLVWKEYKIIQAEADAMNRMQNQKQWFNPQNPYNLGSSQQWPYTGGNNKQQTDVPQQ